MPTSIALAIGAGVLQGTLAAGALAFSWSAFAGSLIMSGISRLTMQKGGPSPVVDQATRTVSVRNSIAAWRVIYGRVRTGGAMTYYQSTNSNRNAHFVYTIAGHEIEAISDFYVDDARSTIDPATNNATGVWANEIFGYEKLGTAGQTAFAELVTNSGGKWTTDHRQRGRACVYLKTLFTPNNFPQGLPNFTWVVKGKKVYDPRTLTTAYSVNPALCLADYLCDATYGLKADYATEIDETALVAAANECEERVAVAANTRTFTANTTSNAITLDSAFSEVGEGDGVRVSTTTTLPAPLVAATTYYAIFGAKGELKLATTFANAIAGVAIDLTTTGTGTHTLTHWDQPRYTLNGSFETSAEPQQVIGQMLSAMAGTCVPIGGQWIIRAGAYETPTVTLTESDLTGPVRIQTRVSAREIFNGVKGTFANPSDLYQQTDYPQITNSTYFAEDNDERKWEEASYPFTTNVVMAQRLSKIALERARQQVSVSLQCKLSAYRVQPGQTVALTFAKFGWTAKAFEVRTLDFAIREDGTLGVDLGLRETASTVWDWNSGEQVAFDSAPDTDLPDPFADLTPINLALSSGTADLFVAGDGTVVSRIRATWDLLDNGLLDRFEVEFKRSADTPWQRASDAPADAEEAFISPVDDGVNYDVRVRGVSQLGNAGAWATVTAHTVVGKTALPANVTGFTALQQGAVVVFGCDTVNDADLDSVEVRLADFGNLVWDDAAPLTYILRGQTSTSAAVPPGAWTFLAKARDTSGNYSATAASADLTVTADGYTTISSRAEAPDFTGTLTNMVRHWSGKLTPDSQTMADDLDWEVFDQFVPDPYADCYYEAAAIDKGIDAPARIYADIVSVLGPGETTGVANPQLEVDHKLNAGSYDGFEAWGIGNANFRQLKGRIHVATADGLPVISGFTLNVDAPARMEGGSLVVGGGGSATQSFAQIFHNTPVVQVTPQGTGDVTASASAISNTGFTGNFKTGGTAGAGTMNWSATGV
jgi:hypothetical protein